MLKEIIEENKKYTSKFFSALLGETLFVWQFSCMLSIGIIFIALDSDPESRLALIAFYTSIIAPFVLLAFNLMWWLFCGIGRIIKTVNIIYFIIYPLFCLGSFAILVL